MVLEVDIYVYPRETFKTWIIPRLPTRKRICRLDNSCLLTAFQFFFYDSVYSIRYRTLWFENRIFNFSMALSLVQHLLENYHWTEFWTCVFRFPFLSVRIKFNCGKEHIETLKNHVHLSNLNQVKLNQSNPRETIFQNLFVYEHYNSIPQ